MSIIILGTITIITALWNLYGVRKKKDTTFIAYISLSFTALTVAALNHFLALQSESEELESFIPALERLSNFIWISALLLIFINSMAFWKRKDS